MCGVTWKKTVCSATSQSDAYVLTTATLTDIFARTGPKNPIWPLSNNTETLCLSVCVWSCCGCRKQEAEGPGIPVQGAPIEASCCGCWKQRKEGTGILKESAYCGDSDFLFRNFLVLSLLRKVVGWRHEGVVWRIMLILDVEKRWTRQDVMELLFELAHFLDGFWATKIRVSGTKVMGTLSASDKL